MPTSHPLDQPEFGPLPEDKSRIHVYKGPPFRYKALLEQVRAHPGQAAKIGFFREVDPKTTNRIAAQHKTQTRLWLKRHFPLEKWGLWIRRDYDTWADRYLWAEFQGTMTEAEAEVYWAERKAVAVALWAKKESNAANRSAREKARAIVQADQDRRSQVARQ